MPGSLLNLSQKTSRHDSSRSDISTYSTDSKKKVSFNKAVRVKKYTKPDDNGEKYRKRLWFRGYQDTNVDHWEEYSGNEIEKNEAKLGIIDEYSPVNNKHKVQQIIAKFNEQSSRDPNVHNNEEDIYNKYKKDSILNGVKTLFGSTSLRNKKTSGSLTERNLENLFRNQNSVASGNAGKKNEILKQTIENNIDKDTNKFLKESKKWESGDQLIFDVNQLDKSNIKTEDGELFKTVQQRDRVWENIIRTITYEESSPKIVRKKENNNVSKTFQPTNHYTSDNYKAIRYKKDPINEIASTDKNNYVTKQKYWDHIRRPSICTRDHGLGTANTKRELGASRIKTEDKENKKDSKLVHNNKIGDSQDYRRNYSTILNGRRARSCDGGIQVKCQRGGLAAAYRNRNQSLSPSRQSKFNDVGTHQHKEVVLYIPGTKKQTRIPEDLESRMSRSQIFHKKESSE